MNKRVFRTSFLILFIFLFQYIIPGGVNAHGPTTHIYIANRVMDDIRDGKVDLPEDVKQAILANPDTFRAGSLGPDMLDGKLSHNEDASGIAQRLMDEALNSGDPKSIAYAYGYLTHMGGDMDGHPLVNQFTGGNAYDYNDPRGMRPGFGIIGEDSNPNPNYLHIYAEGEIDKLTWSNMSQGERDNMDKLLSLKNPGQPPELWNHISPEIINNVVKAVDKPGIDASNVFADRDKPISAYNGEYIQTGVSNVQKLISGSEFEKSKQEIIDAINASVKTSGDLMKNPRDMGFINLDDGTKISSNAIKEFFISKSDRPDGSIDPKFLDSNGNISMKNQQVLIDLIRTKYPDIAKQPPDMQEKILKVLGDRQNVADQVINVIREDDKIKGIVRTDEFYEKIKQNFLNDPVKLSEYSEKLLGKTLPSVSLPTGLTTPSTTIDASTGYRGAEQTTREGTKDTQLETREGTRDTQQATQEGGRDTQQMTREGTKDTQDMTREGGKDTQQMTRDGTSSTQQMGRESTRDTQQMTQQGTRSTDQMSREGQRDVEQMKQEGTRDVQELYRGLGF